MTNHPLVSCGMPVYNEAKYIAESLDSLLAQTYPNIEIVIADNASTDGTSEICAEYAKKHTNIIHVRHSTNIGQSANFNFLPAKATGAYFVWTAGHDLWESDFLSKAVEDLEADAKSVLAATRSVYITADGKFSREDKRDFETVGLTPAGRFLETMWRVDCNYVYGVFRRAFMLKTHLFQQVPAADRVFLSEIALHGHLVHVDTKRLSRWNREAKQTELEKRHRIMAYLYPGKTFTDREITGNHFYKPTQKAFYVAARQANFSKVTKLRVVISIWFAGVIKSHIFPGADALSWIVKVVLPKAVLKKILSKMQ